MDARDVERLLREDAARFAQEVDDADVEEFKASVLDRLGLSRDPGDRTDEPTRPRQRR
jgi:hypothetical protein